MVKKVKKKEGANKKAIGETPIILGGYIGFGKVIGTNLVLILPFSHTMYARSALRNCVRIKK